MVTWDVESLVQVGGVSVAAHTGSAAQCKISAACLSAREGTNERVLMTRRVSASLQHYARARVPAYKKTNKQKKSVALMHNSAQFLQMFLLQILFYHMTKVF